MIDLVNRRLSIGNITWSVRVGSSHPSTQPLWDGSPSSTKTQGVLAVDLGQGFLIKTLQWLTISQHLSTSARFIFSCLPPGGDPKKQWAQVLLLKVCQQKLGSSPPAYTCSGGIGCGCVWHFQWTSFLQWGRGDCLDLSSSRDTVIFWETQQAGRPGQEEHQACEHVDPMFAYFTWC